MRRSRHPVYIWQNHFCIIGVASVYVGLSVGWEVQGQWNSADSNVDTRGWDPNDIALHITLVPLVGTCFLWKLYILQWIFITNLKYDLLCITYNSCQTYARVTKTSRRWQVRSLYLSLLAANVPRAGVPGHPLKVLCVLYVLGSAIRKLSNGFIDQA